MSPFSTPTARGISIEPRVTPELCAPLACSCGQPFARIVVRDGELVIEVVSRHHGERHVNTVSLGTLAAIMAKAGDE